MAGTTSTISFAFFIRFPQSGNIYSYTIMCSIKCSFALAILLVVISTRNVNANNPIREIQQQKQHVDRTPGFQSTISSPYWEYMLRESVFRTISPPPLANNALYKNILDAPLYTGAFLTGSINDETIVHSRGDVYHLPNGHWLFCQEGCINCEPCIRQDTPTLKWILRRIMRLSHYGTRRYDLELTVLPHLDGSYHMKNLWPQSYVYVSSEGQQLEYEIGRATYEDTKSSLWNFEDKLFERQRMSGNFDSFNKGNLDTVDSTVENRSSLETVEKGTTIAVTPYQEVKRKQRLRNFRKQNLRSTTTEKPVDPEFSTVLIEVREDGMKESSPQLILGTDQQGHKHLVHVVATEERSVTHNTTGYGTFNKFNASGVSPGLDAELGKTMKPSLDYNNSDYQRILRKIYYSLNTHRHFIEKFLMSSANLTLRNSKELTPDLQVDKDQETRYRQENLNPVTRYNRNCHLFNISQSPVKEELAVERGRPTIFDSAIRSNPKINTNTVPSLVRHENRRVSAGFKVDFPNNMRTNNSNLDQGVQSSVFLKTLALSHSTTISPTGKTSRLLEQ